MIRDVFYLGKKPNTHPKEKFAKSLQDAREQCTTEDFWIINEHCDYRNFDWEFTFDFHPDEDVWAQDHNNVWPSQHQKDSGTWLCAKTDSDIIIYRNDVDPIRRRPTRDNWEIIDTIDETQFDFSWHPDPTDPPYIYVWGNQWYKPEEFAAVIYKTPKATQYKFMPERINRIPDMSCWQLIENPNIKSFDYSWIPHPKSPPYIYQFETAISRNDGPKYSSFGNDGETIINVPYQADIPKYLIQTTLEDLVNQHPNEVFWAIRKDIDYSKFNFEWRPMLVDVLWELDYVHVFGSTDSESTQTYFVSGKKYLEGYTSFKFVETIKADEKYLSNLFLKPDIFFIDKGNQEASARVTEIQNKLSNFRIHKTRYLNSWVDTISRCVAKSQTNLFWVLNSELDYSEFDFEYYPTNWQMNMVHVFGTQWSHWGTTFLINKERFNEDTKYIKVIEHLSNLNFVKSIRSKATNCLYDIVLIDHGNLEANDVYELLKTKTPRTISIIPYDESYAKTLASIVAKQPETKEHFLWICSSVCDYTNFDFTYICDPFAKEHVHVFPSGKQKFGDTFFVNVNKLKEAVIEELDEYGKVNYNATLRPTRLPEPIIIVKDDTHISAVQQIEGFPYATLVTEDNKDVVADIEPMCLWSPKHKNIIVGTTGATRITVPKEAKSYVKSELYEYPYIKKMPKFAQSKPIDIVFLSNGEKCAEENWQHLQRATQHLKNRVVRVDGVNGRTEAYHAAVKASETPWCFTVFAKLKIDDKFDWSWQPDRMQAPKHYIFYAKNPVNQLTYGHQGMIAYNKKLTLATTHVEKLDFTLSAAHEVVPMISGTATFNIDPWSTWRTSFRETLKLLYYQSLDHNSDTELRLNTWLTKASGEHAEWCLRGANDAQEYFNKVSGDYGKLFLSFEWDWLWNLFIGKYGQEHS